MANNYVVDGLRDATGPQVLKSTETSGVNVPHVNVDNFATPTTFNLNSAATTNATSVKASAGTLLALQVSNINAALRYLKLYNKASAPTVGTDVPFMVFPIPIGGYIAEEFGTLGIRMGTGIALAITGAAADSDTTAVSASEHKVSLSYI